MGCYIDKAYKLKKSSEFWHVVEDIHRRASLNINARLRQLYWDRIVRVDPEDGKYEECQLDLSKAENRLSLVHRDFREAVREASASPYRSAHDLDVSVVFVRHHKSVYVRGFCDSAGGMVGVLDFLARHESLTDFHYQDKTDRPEGISETAWKRRGKTWGELDAVWTKRLTLELCSWDMFWRVTPVWHMMEEFKDNPPMLPPILEVALSDLDVPGLRIEDNAIVGEGIRMYREGKVWKVQHETGDTEHRTVSDAVSQVKYYFAPDCVKRLVRVRVADMKMPCTYESPESCSDTSVTLTPAS